MNAFIRQSDCCGGINLCLLQVPVEVNPDLLQQLTEMGFGETRAARGLHFSGNSTLEVRLQQDQWCSVQHLWAVLLWLGMRTCSCRGGRINM